MYFSLTNPEVAILMMVLFLFAVLMGFPIAFTLMAMGIGFGRGAGKPSVNSALVVCIRPEARASLP